MTLDEAITHEKELAKEIYVEAMLCHANPDDGKLDDCIERGKYHEQVAEWLEDYKRLKELFSKTFIKDCNTCEQEIYQKAYKEGQDKGFSDGHFFGYNKAIDDFVKALHTEYAPVRDEMKKEYKNVCSRFERIAEQLKEGVKNE